MEIFRLNSFRRFKALKSVQVNSFRRFKALKSVQVNSFRHFKALKSVLLNFSTEHMNICSCIHLVIFPIWFAIIGTGKIFNSKFLVVNNLE